MSSDYITVKEYATIKGCSTQYVYKLLATKLVDYVEIVNGKKCLKISVLDADFSKSPTASKSKVANQVDNQVANQVDNKVVATSSSALEEELKRINARNESLIDDLRNEIKEKDAQLSQMNEKIVSLFETNQRLMENNQRLQLNYQMLLGDGKNIQTDEEVEVQGARVEEETEIVPEEKPKKKGFLSWLFND